MPIHGKHENKEDCVNAGLDFLWASCTTTVNNGGGLSYKPSVVPAKQFLEFYEKRNEIGQLSLF